MLKININKELLDDFVNEYRDDVLKRFKIVINSGLYKTKKRKAIKLSKNEKKILTKFNNQESFNYLMSANSKRLRRLIPLILNKFPTFHNKKSNIYKILYNVFVDHGYSKLDKYKFIRELKLKSCAYCNRAYIFTINKNKNLKPEIDHFYPKAIYPYLAISFYNLIPSCPTCNGFGAKGARDSFKEKLKNPYEITNNDFKFTFNIESINIINGKIDEQSIDINLSNFIHANNEYFQLKNLYSEHRDIVIDLYQKTCQVNTKEHFDILSKSLEGLDFKDDEIYQLVTSSYSKDNDFHKRPLSKFTKDISLFIDKYNRDI